MDFAKLLALSVHFNIPIGRAYEYRGEPGINRELHELDLVENVTLPLSHEEWGELCQREGSAYMGGCCPMMSHVQDLLNASFRDDGYMKSTTLAEIAQAMLSHGEGDVRISFGYEGSVEDLANDARLTWKGGEISPWDKIAFTWLLIRENYTPEVVSALRTDMPPLEEAFYVLSNSLQYFSFGRVFHNDSFGSPANKEQREITNTLMVSRLLPALKLLNDHVDSLKVPPVEGYVIVDLNKGPEEVAVNGFGYCFFRELSEIHQLVQMWKRSQEEYKEQPPYKLKELNLGVRRARISSEKGIEFLDEKPEALS
jgi:hypothetical protein